MDFLCQAASTDVCIFCIQIPLSFFCTYNQHLPCPSGCELAEQSVRDQPANSTEDIFFKRFFFLFSLVGAFRLFLLSILSLIIYKAIIQTCQFHLSRPLALCVSLVEYLPSFVLHTTPSSCNLRSSLPGSWNFVFPIRFSGGTGALILICSSINALNMMCLSARFIPLRPFLPFCYHCPLFFFSSVFS